MRMDGRKMTYGGAQGRPVPQRRRPSPQVLVAAVVAGVVVVGMLMLMFRPRGNEQALPAGAATPAASVSTPAAVSDAAYPLSAGAREVAEQFVEAYVATDPAARQQMLTETASPTLAQQLTAAPAPAVRPLGALEGTQVPGGAKATQPLDGGGRLQLELSMDGQSAQGWRVVAAEEV